MRNLNTISIQFDRSLDLPSHCLIVLDVPFAKLRSKALVNVSILVKFSLKASVFYLNYHKISIKSYVLNVY